MRKPRLALLTAGHLSTCPPGSSPPAPPDEMVTLASTFDVGLSLEEGGSINNRLALGNKALTYLLAGLALAMTDTPGHRPLKDELGTNALVVSIGDLDRLAEGLRRFASEREHLLRCPEGVLGEGGLTLALGARGGAGKAPASLRGADLRRRRTGISPQPESRRLALSTPPGPPPPSRDEIQAGGPPFTSLTSPGQERGSGRGRASS